MTPTVEQSNIPPAIPPTQPVVVPAAPTQSAKNPWYTFAGLAITEIGFILILLVATLGTLNYFRLVSLEKFFPSLSFLPHQTSQTTPSSVSSGTFLYDVNTANIQLTNFVKTSLASSYQQSSPSADLYITHKNNISEAIWFFKSVSATATFAYSPHTNIVDYQLISIGPVHFSPISHADTSTSAASLAQQFFSHPPDNTKWQCKKYQENWYCQNLQGQQMYSLQRAEEDAQNEFINAQVCMVRNVKIFNPQSQIGCLTLVQKN